MIRRRVVWIALTAVLALLAAAFVGWILIGRPTTSYYVPSDSMSPTIRVGERILARGVGGGYTPRRFDVIVFSDPGGWLGDHQGGHVLKRVIGLPGETVACCTSSGQLTVDGSALNESGFLPRGLPCDGPARQDNGHSVLGGCKGWSAVVPLGALFLMGDNRTESSDSSWHLCSPGEGLIMRGTGVPCSLAFVPISDVVAIVVS
ncbi:signal peptidase I [Nocardioides baekrokdamisoli]|uniref:Signal peptidase I n=1 Tax=Nocardioides baekrokdamisoli TaxID=1804624 RepID=A0A3G9IAZ5_9ACTN|nr:signal peptidase I [Nocardioides baekrokdamisoli]BBH15947.1 signal peptidase I [Nocardioides baekrokdamisoli]